MSASTAEVATPPVRRESTGPIPLAIFVAGIVAIALVVIGSVAIQTWFAIEALPVTPDCRRAGLIPGRIDGASGVCRIVEALESPAQTLVLVAALVIGAVALVSGAATYRHMSNRRMREQSISGAVLGVQGAVLAALLLWFRAGDTTIFSRQFLNFGLLEGWFNNFLNGAKNTMYLAFVGEFGGIAIGLVLALLVLSHRRVIRAPARAYINFFRGTPLIWQLGFFYFGIALGLRVQMEAFQTAMLVFALNTGAYAAEVFRAGIQSVERGQMEAARSLGMSYLQAMRYAIVPQAIRRVIPPLMNEFVILIKDTALITILGLLITEYDLYTTARSGYSETGNATFFLAAAVGYLVVTLPLIRVVTLVEQKLRSGLTGIVGHA